jgi:hypothetical protein
MNSASLAAGLAAAHAAQMQTALAAKLMKMNAANAQALVQLVEAGQANIERLVNAAPGLGANIDLSI